MSKKKFTDGLDDLLNEAGAEQPAAGPETPSRTTGRKPSGHKTFASDLDALLEEALQESIEKYTSGKPLENKVRQDADTTPAARFSGIDALIRQTISVEDWSTDEHSGKKRLTVSVDRPKLEKLKVIARLENAYLKDLMVELIDEFIQNYTRNKGIEL